MDELLKWVCVLVVTDQDQVEEKTRAKVQLKGDFEQKFEVGYGSLQQLDFFDSKFIRELNAMMFFELYLWLLTLYIHSH